MQKHTAGTHGICPECGAMGMTCNLHEAGADLFKACKAVVEDYIHLAQDADGKADQSRRSRYVKMKEAIAKAQGYGDGTRGIIPIRGA